MVILLSGFCFHFPTHFSAVVIAQRTVPQIAFCSVRYGVVRRRVYGGSLGLCAFLLDLHANISVPFRTMLWSDGHLMRVCFWANQCHTDALDNDPNHEIRNQFVQNEKEDKLATGISFGCKMRKLNPIWSCTLRCITRIFFSTTAVSWIIHCGIWCSSEPYTEYNASPIGYSLANQPSSIEMQTSTVQTRDYLRLVLSELKDWKCNFVTAVSCPHCWDWRHVAANSASNANRKKIRKKFQSKNFVRLQVPKRQPSLAITLYRVIIKPGETRLRLSLAPPFCFVPS